MRDRGTRVSTEGSIATSRESGSDRGGSREVDGAEAASPAWNADHRQETSDSSATLLTYEEAARKQMKMMSKGSPRGGRLYRRVDVSGISGSGTVAWVVEFPDGSCVLRWCTEKPGSTAVYASKRDLEEIHGHGGVTVVIWDD